MSFQKRGRKIRPNSGKTIPSSSGRIGKTGGHDFTTVIAETLRKTFGHSGRSIKTVMAYTGAGERTVRNWFECKNGPSGHNLIELLRNSDEILEAVLLMAGREEVLAGKLLVDARDMLVEMLEIINELQAKNQATRSLGETEAR